MQPTKQTILHDPENGKHGNCLSAVIASLLHLPIADVPVFSDPKNWMRDLNLWLRPFDLGYMPIQDFDRWCEDIGISGCFCEIYGTTQRSDETLHACVAVDGNQVFDPHPDNSGLQKVWGCGVFISLKPWRVAESRER